MAVGDKVLGTDLSGFYTRLNQVRSKANLSSYSVPSKAGSTAKSSDIQTLDSYLNSTASSIKWISKTSIGTYSAGTKISNSLKTNITSLLNNWYNTCFHNSNYTDFDDNGDFGHDDDFGNDVVDGTWGD